MSTRSEARDHAPLTPRERLAPLLWRRFSLWMYRRSERFGRHRGRTSPEDVLPVPDLVDTLTVYFLDRLPARTVARIGVPGCRRRARALASVLTFGRALARPAWRLARGAYRLVRRRGDRAAPSSFPRRAPVENLHVTLADRVELCGFAFDGANIRTYWRRVASAPHPVQIFVHLYPSGPPDAQSGGAPLRICKDHDPHLPLTEWPRGRVYEDAVNLCDVPPGDYRVDIGMIDLVRLERFEDRLTGQTAVDLGWIRLRPPEAAAPQAARAKGAAIARG